MSQWVTEFLICWFTTVFPILKGIQFFSKFPLINLAWIQYSPFSEEFQFCSKFPTIISAKKQYSSFTKSFLLFKINLSFLFFFWICQVGLKNHVRPKFKKNHRQISSTRVWTPKIRVVTWWRPVLVEPCCSN